MTRRAFTLIEMIVVITLLGVIVSVGLPAFNSMLRGSERTMAANQLRVGLTAARDLALRGEGVDSAAVFAFEPGGKVRIVPCVWVGQIDDVDAQHDDDGTGFTGLKRDVFAPSPLMQPAELPKGWSVRAFATPGSLDDNQVSTGNANGWYAESSVSVTVRTSGMWVFPETGFYDVDSSSDLKTPGQAGQNTHNGHALRNTFMVRFEGGTGRVKPRQGAPAVVVMIRPSEKNRGTIGGASNRYASINHPDNAPDLVVWARRVLELKQIDSGAVTPGRLRQLIGNESGDTVLAGEVLMLSVHEEAVMVTQCGASGVNRTTGTVYTPTSPVFDAAVVSAAGGADQFQKNVNSYMLGRLTRNGVPVTSDLILYGFEPSTGMLREIKP